MVSVDYLLETAVFLGVLVEEPDILRQNLYPEQYNGTKVSEDDPVTHNRLIQLPKDGAAVRLQHAIHQETSLIGRSSSVFTSKYLGKAPASNADAVVAANENTVASQSFDTDEDAVTKISYPPAGRTSEVKFIEMAEGKAENLAGKLTGNWSALSSLTALQTRIQVKNTGFLSIYQKSIVMQTYPLLVPKEDLKIFSKMEHCLWEQNTKSVPAESSLPSGSIR